MRISASAFLPLLALFIPAGVHAQSSGLDFLNIGPGTESLSMAEAVTARSLGASSLYVNPANLAFESSSSLSADYTLWIADIYNSHLAVNLRRNRSAFAFGLLNSRSGNFEARLTPGPPDGTFSVNYLSLAAGYALAFRNLSFGLTGQFLSEEFYVNHATGFAFDAGIAGRWLEGRLRTGFSLLNIGRMNELADTATELPINLRAGAGAILFQFTPPKNRDLPVLVSLFADYVKPLRDTVPDNPNYAVHGTEGSLNIGIVLDIAETVTMRAGYKTGDSERPFGAGIGLRLEELNFEYAMIPFRTGFGTAHSVGLQYRF